MDTKADRSRAAEIETPVRPGLAGRLALGLLGAHVLILFFPPLPPDVQGSVWSYLLGYVAVILAAVEIRASAGPLARCWGRMAPNRRALIGVATVVGLLGLGLTVRAWAPDLFARWSREEGLWEPLTLTSLLAGAILLRAAARAHRSATRRHLTLIAGGFLLLVLEEIDYFGVFGALIGRVDGVYVGSPHDLIGLAAEVGLPAWSFVAVAGPAALGAALLLRSGHLQPRRILRDVRPPRGLWLAGYPLALGLAQLEDIGVFYLLGEPRLEELLELAGSVMLLGFAAGVAGDAIRRGEVERPETSSGAPGDRTGSRSDELVQSDSGPLYRFSVGGALLAAWLRANRAEPDRDPACRASRRRGRRGRT